MRRFLTKKLFCSLLCLGLPGLNNVAHAQVYKSYDDEGNVVFSDKPTRGSREIEVSKPNLSDSFEIPPPPPVESPIEAKPGMEPEPESTAQPIAGEESADTNNDGRISRREKEEQRKAQRKKRREEAKAAEENGR